MCRNRRWSSITLCLYGWHASPFFRWLRHDWWSLFVALSVLTSSCRGLKRGFCSDFSVSWSLLFFAASGNLKLDIHPTSSNLVLKKTFWGRWRRNRTVFLFSWDSNCRVYVGCKRVRAALFLDHNVIAKFSRFEKHFLYHSRQNQYPHPIPSHWLEDLGMAAILRSICLASILIYPYISSYILIYPVVANLSGALTSHNQSTGSPTIFQALEKELQMAHDSLQLVWGTHVLLLPTDWCTLRDDTGKINLSFLEKHLSFLEKNPSFLEKNLRPWKKNTGKTISGSPDPLVLWSSGPLVLWSPGPLVVPWFPANTMQIA